jgi:putative RecB family exonuclease
MADGDGSTAPLEAGGRAPAPSGAASPEPGPPAHLSPSSAATFEQCPRRWRFRHVERLDDPPGVPAVIGTFAHLVLELLLNEPPSARTPERARALARGAWPRFTGEAEFAGLALAAEDVRAFKWRVWRAVEGLWQLEDPTAVEVHGTEARVAVELGGVPFVGIVDRVDTTADGLVVTDYKSGLPPAEAYVAAKLEQVLLYAAAVAALTGERPVRARLLYLVGPRRIEVEPTDEATGAAVARLAGTWSEVSRRLAGAEFEPRPGVLCAWCPFLDRCPEGRKDLEARVADGWRPVGAPGLRLVA